MIGSAAEHDALEGADPALIQFLYQVPIGLLQIGTDGAIEMLNPMAAQLLLPLAGGGGALDNLYAALAAHLPQLAAQVAAHAGGHGVVCEGLRFDCAPAAGARRTLAISVVRMSPARLMATLIDVTHDVRREQQGLDRRLRDASFVDGLTQMPNRAALCERIAQALARSDRSFALLFLNADRFKRVNDRLGLAAGDALLGLMADRLRAALRSEDHVGHLDAPVAARIGGDEFVVLLDRLPHPADAHAVAQRLLAVLAQPYRIGGQTVHCSVSIGVVMAPEPGADADAVLQDASLAMLQAKRDGNGNRYAVFEPALRDEAARRSGIEAALRQALDEGQLFVVYQPVVELSADGSIDRGAGVEALVRWRHPERGIVPPLDFIPVAEECGLIGAVGEVVLRHACRDYAQWQRVLGAAAPRRLAVNLSRAQLAQPGFADSVRAALHDHGVPVAALQLEVTESLAAQDDAVQRELHALKAIGLTLALDDFGTGYSSLASLHLLPVDTVKIDRSFVAQSDSSEHHRVLIEATVRVAASLGMGTVAEGIETEHQASVVRRLGCGRAQGYFYSRPLPADELLRWLEER